MCYHKHTKWSKLDPILLHIILLVIFLRSIISSVLGFSLLYSQYKKGKTNNFFSSFVSFASRIFISVFLLLYTTLISNSYVIQRSCTLQFTTQMKILNLRCFLLRWNKMRKLLFNVLRCTSICSSFILDSRWFYVVSDHYSQV